MLPVLSLTLILHEHVQPDAHMLSEAWKADASGPDRKEVPMLLTPFRVPGMRHCACQWP